MESIEEENKDDEERARKKAEKNKLKRERQKQKQKDSKMNSAQVQQQVASEVTDLIKDLKFWILITYRFLVWWYKSRHKSRPPDWMLQAATPF